MHRSNLFQISAAVGLRARAGCDCLRVLATDVPIMQSDMTRPDLQRATVDEKPPWEIGKRCDRSAPIDPLHLASQTDAVAQDGIWLEVNAGIRQSADLGPMIECGRVDRDAGRNLRTAARRHRPFRHPRERGARGCVAMRSSATATACPTSA